MIDSRDKLKAWLEGRPKEHAQIIAARAALRVLPYAFKNDMSVSWKSEFSISIFRGAAITWARRNSPAHSMNSAFIKARMAAYRARASSPSTSAADGVADAVGSAIDVIDVEDLPEAAAFAARAAGAAEYAIYRFSDTARMPIAAFWSNITADCDWFAKSKDAVTDARRLTREPLWPRGTPNSWDETWADAKARLFALSSNFKVWTDWYDRRVEGHDAAFDIPGDINRTEDKKILARLADATNEDFWDKGATYVNTTLQGWIDEARARVAPLPEQDPAAITYGVNDRDQLDRLPASDQKHLRDIPDQQFLYGRIREAALDLLGEGQRLGVPLSRALNRFAVAMPKDFAAALALPIWAEGIILRRLYRAHRIAFESKELSSDQLEPVVAEGLGGLLDLYNHFAFGDDGLRAKDETTIPPQERPSAEAEAAAAAPIAAALLQTPKVATDIVIDDIMAEADAQPDGSPYDDQARDHTNRNWRNRVAAILTGLRKTVVVVGKETAKGVYSGLINMGMTDAATGTHTLAALGLLVATNAQAFITYVSTAFPTYNLGPLIEKIARLFG